MARVTRPVDVPSYCRNTSDADVSWPSHVLVSGSSEGNPGQKEKEEWGGGEKQETLYYYHSFDMELWNSVATDVSDDDSERVAAPFQDVSTTSLESEIHLSLSFSLLCLATSVSLALLPFFPSFFSSQPHHSSTPPLVHFLTPTLPPPTLYFHNPPGLWRNAVCN